MNKKDSQLLKKLIKRHFSEKNIIELKKNTRKLSLAEPPFDWKEVYEALDSMLERKTTMGEKVRKFERMFAKYIGVKHALMVNSGSSANLLALSILANHSLGSKKIISEDEIITPAVTWSTTVFPMRNINAKPVFVDVDENTFSIEPEKIEKAITKKTKAIMVVHLLGYPCEMDKIRKIAKKNNLYLIEDSCEALGAEYKNMKVGSMGDLATFSFFASHHITTMEGGMLVTNNSKFYEIGKSLRAHGWTRDKKDRKKIEKKYPKINPNFLFENIGYNLRPTEVQGAFGIHQIKKLNGLINKRISNANKLKNGLKIYSKFLRFHPDSKNIKNSNMVFPITVIKNKFFTKDQLTKHLGKNNIDTRPVMTGNIIDQPVMKYIKFKKGSELKNSEYISNNSFLIGNHHLISSETQDYVIKCISSFLEKKLNSRN
jgi:CDP-4-dehydro-6-deoxyglucose reductase, E1